jgi:hypothetical protein
MPPFGAIMSPTHVPADTASASSESVNCVSMYVAFVGVPLILLKSTLPHAKIRAPATASIVLPLPVLIESTKYSPGVGKWNAVPPVTAMGPFVPGASVMSFWLPWNAGFVGCAEAQYVDAGPNVPLVGHCDGTVCGGKFKSETLAAW